MERIARRAKPRIDMTTGPMFSKIIRFMLPLIATNMLQQFYHAADIMIVGLSPELDAVGAIGSTSSFIALINNLFIGFSVGANIVVARCIGHGDKEKTSQAVHTALCMGVLFGALGALIGIVLTRPILLGMGYEGNLLTLAVRYAYIYLACLPFLALTNFLSAILQAQGNTKTSLYVLTATGILNIGLNLFFVLVVGLSVEGVAIATAIANLVSATVLWRYLAKNGTACRIEFRRLRMHREQFVEIARIGFPSGLQNAFFSLSNIVVQSAILQVNNLLTPVGSAYAPVVKGNAAVGSLENFIFSALSAVTVTASTFTAQNMGAGNYRRVRRGFAYICAVAVGIGILIPLPGALLRTPLIALYGVRDEGDFLSGLACRAAYVRMFVKWPFMFLFSFTNSCAGTIRGRGHSTLAAGITFFTTCVFRVLWIYTVFQAFQTMEMVYVSHPVSWVVTGACLLLVTLLLMKRKIAESESEREAPLG